MKFVLLPVALSVLLLPVSGRAADHSAIMPYVTDDVAAVAYVDLASFGNSAWLDNVRQLTGIPQEQWNDATGDVLKLQRWVRQLVDRGAARAYVLVRAADVQHSGPTWVLALTGTADPNAVVQSLSATGDEFPRPVFFPRQFRVADGVVLAAMDSAQMERLATRRVGPPRDEAMAALTQLGQSSLGLVVLGDADSRRVLREMFPRLPAPFNGIDGRTIADDLLWGGLAIDLLPQPKLTIQIETSAPRVAATLQQAAVQGLDLAKQLLMANVASAPRQVMDQVEQTLAMFKPSVDGMAVKLTVGEDADELIRLRGLLAAPMAAAKEAAERAQRISLFKQLALALANYESVNNALVGPASYDQAGRPLLSWRVHLLPYLDQQALYAEFHLDEPWDSPHNRQLIERMPACYADPSSAVLQAVGAGRTTFVTPVAVETLFPPRAALPQGEPVTLRDVKDGTSKTIAFVEVVPERAVVWTKPDDWEVQLSQPLQGVQRADRSGFTVAFCDGSVRYLTNDITPQQFAAMLTRAGGERVD
jgi:hypothetical protein